MYVCFLGCKLDQSCPVKVKWGDKRKEVLSEPKRGCNDVDLNKLGLNLAKLSSNWNWTLLQLLLHYVDGS